MTRTMLINHDQALKMNQPTHPLNSPHVLHSINPKSGHTQANQVVHVVDDLRSRPVHAEVQIGQTHEPAVAHLIRIVVVVDRA
jgi:hypothetical protein